MSYTFLVLVLVLALTRVRPGVVRGGGPSEEDIIEEMRAYKMEVIKSRILQEVRFPVPPSATAHLELPPHLLNLLLHDKEAEDHFLEEGEKLVAYPVNENQTCESLLPCAHFEFELPTEGRSVSSLHFWLVGKEDDQFANVSVCTSPGKEGACDTRERLFQVASEMGSVIFHLPSKVFSTNKSDSLYIQIEVQGPRVSEFGGSQKPYLVADLTSSERTKRSAPNGGATKNCTCCLTDFFVNFKSIGWHWVVAPLGFNAKMCYGKCNGQLNSYPSHYHRLMSAIRSNKTLSEDLKEDFWTPCCSPAKLLPLNMIYVAGNNTSSNSSSSFIYHKIPDMITSSCGCN